jgi:hypothetical protein
MREALSDVLRQCGSLFTILKVTGTAEDTKFGAVNDEKTLFLKMVLKDNIPEFEGDFGISNLGLLNGLLSFTSYRTDGSTFKVKRRSINGSEIVEQIEFKDANKTGATFRFMSPDLVPEQVELRGQINWDVVFSPDKSKLSEFTTLSGLYSEVEKTFVPRTDSGNLIFHVGNDNSSTHNASMVFQDGITGTLTGDLRYSTGQFLSVMKLAGQYASVISITSRGVMKITVETQFGTYDYYLRSERG